MPTQSIPQSGVYQIICLSNQKVYIGSSVNIKNRWRWHRAALKQGRHHSKHLQRAWNQYGADSFRFEVMEHCQPEDCHKREQWWIDKIQSYEPKHGFNIARNTEKPTLGVHLSEEHRAKIGKAHRGMKRPPEHGQKISQAHKGRKHTEQSCKHMSEAHKGHVHTETHKRRIGAKSKVNWQNPEYREKVLSNKTLTTRDYIVTDPNGDETQITNLSEFCRQRGLSQANLNAVATGRRAHHKGWKCRHVD